MFRLFNCGEGKKELRELSLKQRQQLIDYQREVFNREWPQLRPPPVIIPPRDLRADTPRNTPT